MKTEKLWENITCTISCACGLFEPALRFLRSKSEQRGTFFLAYYALPEHLFFIKIVDICAPITVFCVLYTEQNIFAAQYIN